MMHGVELNLFLNWPVSCRSPLQQKQDFESPFFFSAVLLSIERFSSQLSFTDTINFSNVFDRLPIVAFLCARGFSHWTPLCAPLKIITNDRGYLILYSSLVSCLSSSVNENDQLIINLGATINLKKNISNLKKSIIISFILKSNYFYRS